MLLLASPAAAEDAEGCEAVLTDSVIYINDQRSMIAGYNIDGQNYFRLRDLAAALSGTSSQFDVTWNGWERQVELATGVAYTGDLWAENLPELATARVSTAGLLVDGRREALAAYNIQGSSYYGLRDMGELLGFDVYWVENERCVCIYTGLGGAAVLTESSGGDLRVMNREKSTQRWARACASYLYEDGDTAIVFDVSGGEEWELLRADRYDRESWELLDSWNIPLELDFFGGFYAGEEYNYIVFGSNNMEADNSKEIIRVVKYSKDFQRLDDAYVTGGQCVTLRPFDAGTLRMSEWGSELVIHTSRATYVTGDKVDGESQLTLILDTEDMEVINDLGLYQGGVISNSYNQFVQHDNGVHILVDHGDASPRSVLLRRYDGGEMYTSVTLFQIPGRRGASCTGVTVGGFEVSESSYLVAVNSVRHDWVDAYTDYTLEGLAADERDVVLLSCGKEGLEEPVVEQIVLTDYAGTGRLGSTPYLVKLAEDRFLVLWEEFAYYESDFGVYDAASGGVRYVEVDGAGRPLMPVQYMPDARLSYDCQPVVLDGTVVWYVNARAGRIFYRLAL